MSAPATEKTVYLIRHGETRDSRRYYHQAPDIPLSYRGLAQATRLRRALEEYEFEAVIASDFFRARETALLALGHRYEIETNALFREIKKPTELTGGSFFAPRSVVAMASVYLHARDSQWHWSDEENVHDTFRRANDALDFLAARPEQSIAVISHRGFMAAMLSVVKNHAHGTLAQFLHTTRHSMLLANTSLTTLTFSNEPCENDDLTNTCWRIVRTNDRTHLRG